MAYIEPDLPPTPVQQQRERLRVLQQENERLLAQLFERQVAAAAVLNAERRRLGLPPRDDLVSDRLRQYVLGNGRQKK